MLFLLLSALSLASPCPGNAHPAGIEGDATWCETSAGVRHGPSAMWHPDGAHIATTGRFKHGERHGVWRRFDTQGRLMVEGRYDHGRQVGVWRSFYPSGSVSQVARYRDGHGQGAWTWHRDDGTVRRIGAYVSGQRHGLFVTFDRNGHTTTANRWVHGTPVGDPRPVALRAASARLVSADARK